MEKKYTAHSRSLNQYFDVYLRIDNSNDVKMKIVIYEIEYPCSFNIVQGKDCVNLSNDAIKALNLKVKQKDANLALTTPCKKDHYDFEIEAKRRREEVKTAKTNADINALIVSKRVVYVLMRGGDSHKYSVGIGELMPQGWAGFKEEYQPVRVVKSTDISREIAGMANNAQLGNYTVNGFYGDTWLITKEQYDAVLKAKTEATTKIPLIREQKENKYKEKFEEAARTGQPVFLYELTDYEPCKEECCIDIYKYYAMPDGAKKVERIHTY